MSAALFTLGFIDGLGGPEIVVILFVILILFGGQRLPELARGLGKSIKEFKKATAGVEEEIKRAIEEAPARPTKSALRPPEPLQAKLNPPGGNPASASTSTPPPPAAPANPPAATPPRTDTQDDAGPTDI